MLNTATVGLKVGGYGTAYADFPLNYVFPRKEALDGARDKIIQSLGATLRAEQSLSMREIQRVTFLRIFPNVVAWCAVDSF